MGPLDINEVVLIAPWERKMAETKSSKPNDEIPNTQELRMRMLEREMAEMKKDEELRRRKLKERDDLVDNFLTKHVTDDERATILRLVRIAAENGKTEALVYSFPSDLCSDGGRAINNAQPDWPDTLQGKARELYERYIEVARPKGYRLKAMIINFPGGIPGDVGFYLDWK
jgi:hypothetical protein